MSLFDLLKKRIVEHGEEEKAKIAEKGRQEEERKANETKLIAEKALRKEETLKIAKQAIEKEKPIFTFSILKIGHENQFHTYYSLDERDLYSAVTIDEDMQCGDDINKSIDVYVVWIDNCMCGEISEETYVNLESLNIDPSEMTAYITKIGTTSSGKISAKVSVYLRRTIHSYVAGIKYDNDDGSSRQEVARRLSLDSLLRANPVEFKGEDAVELWYQDNMIGYVIKDLASEITNRMQDGSLHEIKVTKKSIKDNTTYIDISISVS